MNHRPQLEKVKKNQQKVEKQSKKSKQVNHRPQLEKHQKEQKNGKKQKHQKNTKHKCQKRSNTIKTNS